MSEYRKRAPGQASEHPDWILSLSGGVDSVAAAVVAIGALRSDGKGGNYAKSPVAVYLDTRTGAPLNRLYCEQFCDWLGVQLWTLRTEEKFEDWLRRDGAPGAAAHQEVRNELKDRQVSKLTTMADDPVYVLGIAADESETRAGYGKVRGLRRHTEVYPVHRVSRNRRLEMILRADAPRNPLWEQPRVIADCGCLANGDPSELDKTEELFPNFAQRLREWEESIDYDGIKDTLGWGGLSADEYAAKRDGYEQATLSTCGINGQCQRQRDPSVVRAFKADAHGASTEESVSILYDTRKQPAEVTT